MVLTQLFIMATGFMDTAMAGHYSSVDLAGLSLGGNILWPVFLLLTGVTMALTPITSQLRGGGDIKAVGHQLRQGLWMCLVTSTLLVTVMLNAGPIYAFAGVDSQATQIAVDYLAAVAWGIPPVIFYVALRHVSEGLGQPRPPMLIAASILPLNGILNYAFIYGEWVFPQLGGVVTMVWRRRENNSSNAWGRPMSSTATETSQPEASARPFIIISAIALVVIALVRPSINEAPANLEEIGRVALIYLVIVPVMPIWIRAVWNSVLPNIGPFKPIGYWQALGLAVLAALTQVW